ncbi:MAG TPA: hypothetical protein VI056_05405 [Candidatus Limnocylindria bacterium]
MTVPVPTARFDELRAVEHAIRGIGARLMLGLGGFYLHYGAFAEDEP